MNRLKRTLASEKKKTARIGEDVKAKAKLNALALYTEYLRGIIAEPIINASEVEQLANYREQRGIDDKDHNETLKKLYLDEKKFDEMKDFDTGLFVCLYIFLEIF